MALGAGQPPLTMLAVDLDELSMLVEALPSRLSTLQPGDSRSLEVGLGGQRTPSDLHRSYPCVSRRWFGRNKWFDAAPVP